MSDDEGDEVVDGRKRLRALMAATAAAGLVQGPLVQARGMGSHRIEHRVDADDVADAACAIAEAILARCGL